MPADRVSEAPRGPENEGDDASRIRQIVAGIQTNDVMLDVVRLARDEGYAIPASGWGALYIPLAGAIDVTVPGGDTVTVQSGGCAGVPSGGAHTIAGPLARPPFHPVTALEARRAENAPLTVANQPGGSGRVLEVFRARVSNAAHPLPRLVPAAVALTPAEVENAPGLASALTLLRELAPLNRPLISLIKCRVAEIIAVMLLTRVFEREKLRVDDLLEAAFDERIRRVVQAIHEDPARAWTLDTLARHARLSRSSFARRFREATGEAPIAYLTRTRMNLASSYLQNLDWPIDAIAQAVGYRSEAAFISAFRRQMHISPGRFRRVARTGWRGD